MVSKRKFLSIVIMMSVLLFLFQFTLVLRDAQNTYDSNQSYVQRESDGVNAWQCKTIDSYSWIEPETEYVLFVGDSSSPMATEISRWCMYAKYDIAQVSSIDEFNMEASVLPRMMILSSLQDALDYHLDMIKELEQRGVTVVFGSLEEPEIIMNNASLMDFLGIRAVVSTQTEVDGIRLFEGLLLGDEITYEEPEDPEEKYRQDLQLRVPWYRLSGSTKTYMAGTFSSKKQIKNEECPALIWKKGTGNGGVFCVVGDYMKDSTAAGLLDGILTESSSYYIYPVVNAQNLSVTGFPFFANENQEQMMEMYNQSITGMERDSVWPYLISVVGKSRLKMTCFLQTQTDYMDEIQPMDRDFLFYMKQLKEQEAEAGVSLDYKNALSMEDVLNQDYSFFQSTGSAYQYGAAFVKQEEIESVKNLMNTDVLRTIGTLVSDSGNDPVVSYCTDSVTLQGITENAMHYTYRDDIRFRSILSALGYTNILLDMQDVFLTENEDAQWQMVQKRFSSNLLTYWKNDTAFNSTTVSESNLRTRKFLNVNYTDAREDNVITLNASETGSWFVLRTHGEKINYIEGGSQKKLEEDAYLIQVQNNTVKIQVGATDLR